MEFIVTDGPPISGELRYDRHGLSFDFRPADPSIAQHARDAVELMVGSMALQVERSSGDLLGVWGYHPDATWQAETLVTPTATRARIRVRVREIPPHGVALRLVAASDLTTMSDARSGWIRVGRADGSTGSKFIEFAVGIIAELAGEDLIALWLHPGPVS